MKTIPLVECFGPTIQGEGSVIGQQTYFLRFGLCDYKCTMCDSMHAVDPNQVRAGAKWLRQYEIAEQLAYLHRSYPNSTRWVTFTGGNPCIHDLLELVRLLRTWGWLVHVETQGTLYPDWLDEVDSLCISPKGPGMGENTDLEVLDTFVYRLQGGRPNLSATMKVVVFDQRDLEFAAMLYERYRSFWNIQWYLSLGNPSPPGYEQPIFFASPAGARESALARYRMLFDDIKCHPVLSKFYFLPQWHWFVWGNEKGR